MVDPSKLAVIGYCFSGTVAVEFAETGAPIVGLVSVHHSFRNFSRKRRRTSGVAC
jgi:dienelactone hydrolase